MYPDRFVLRIFFPLAADSAPPTDEKTIKASFDKMDELTASPE
jgi:hypothetical protein